MQGHCAWYMDTRSEAKDVLLRHKRKRSEADAVVPWHKRAGSEANAVMPWYVRMGSGVGGRCARHAAMGCGMDAVFPWHKRAGNATAAVVPWNMPVRNAMVSFQFMTRVERPTIASAPHYGAGFFLRSDTRWRRNAITNPPYTPTNVATIQATRSPVTTIAIRFLSRPTFAIA